MTSATAQRTVSIGIQGTSGPNVQASYSFWSPNDGLVRVAANQCHLTNHRATNTLFVLDYQSTLNGWTMVEISPNPPGAPALEFLVGPQGTSLMTMDIFEHMRKYAYFIHYKNTVTGGVAVIDPQEGNEPGGG